MVGELLMDGLLDGLLGGLLDLDGLSDLDGLLDGLLDGSWGLQTLPNHFFQKLVSIDVAIHSLCTNFGSVTLSNKLLAF